MSINPIIIKKGPSVSRVPGVFPSVRFGEQCVSTGIPSLDSYIGGGIPLGTICIIKDTFPSRFGDLILKCFMAEGSSYNHHGFISSGKHSARTFADQLPCLKKSQKDELELPADRSSTGSGGSDIKIAWRYKTPNSGTGIVKGQKEAKFIFTKKTTFEDLGGQYLTLHDPFVDNHTTTPEDALLKEIFKCTIQFELEPNNKEAKSTISNLCRIGLSHCEEIVLNPMFLKGLRSIVRHTNSCALITISDYHLKSSTAVIEHFADTVIQLEAIVEDTKKIELGDVDGLCFVSKIVSVKSLKPFLPPQDIGFGFRRNRLTFTDLSIPPEGENTVQRETSSKSTGCGTVKGKSIDF